MSQLSVDWCSVMLIVTNTIVATGIKACRQYWLLEEIMFNVGDGIAVVGIVLGVWGTFHTYFKYRFDVKSSSNGAHAKYVTKEVCAIYNGHITEELKRLNEKVDKLLLR